MDKQLEEIFTAIEVLTNANPSDSLETLLKKKLTPEEQAISNRPVQWIFVEKVITTVTKLSNLIKDDTSILISVKNQKLLKCCFQLITCVGLVPCLIPGVGIALSKRSDNSSKLPILQLNDTDKYLLLKMCTDFFINSYNVPVLKSIILSSHLADYLAALIQLSYAPLKKPGIYDNFIMTHEMYDQLMQDRLKYTNAFENLVSNCFQPMIMKELLILQSVTDPSPPAFLKRVTSRELSKRLLAPGGVLSLIRCFIESQAIDVGQEWKKIDLIKRIIGARHGNLPEDIYLTTICKQLKEILSSNNVHYYSTTAACIFHLREKYPQHKDVQILSDEIFKCFRTVDLEAKDTPPGSIVFTSQETEHKINVLHSFFCVLRLTESFELLSPNLYLIFLLRLRCTKSDDLKEKLNSLIFKYLDEIKDDTITKTIRQLLFGIGVQTKISVEEHDSGILVKQMSSFAEHPLQEAGKYFIEQSKRNVNSKISDNLFKVCLDQLLSITEDRKKIDSKSLMEIEDNPEIMDNLDANYAIILQMLEELCAVPKIVSSVMINPECIVNFIEKVLLHPNLDSTDECVMIALVLLNTMLTETRNDTLKKRCGGLIPVLQKLSSKTECSFLADEVVKLITGMKHTNIVEKSEFEKIVSDIFDGLLPVRAHGIMELTKLIEKKDPETISKKHYVMCLFQEHLKDEDSYVYLSAINGIAALGKHCTEDVLNVLCKEFVECSAPDGEIQTAEVAEKRAQLRMKVGDVIVKVTRSLGEMAVVHKALLLNTVLCVCKDHDPLVRASALSNLAELALVLNYRLGTILYEVLLCVGSVIDTDGSPECRRAAVMVTASLLKGLGKQTLLQLKDSLLPLYRTLKKLHFDSDEDHAVRLHAQIALEELDGVVRDFLFQKIDMSKEFVVGDAKIDIKFK